MDQKELREIDKRIAKEVMGLEVIEGWEETSMFDPEARPACGGDHYERLCVYTVKPGTEPDIDDYLREYSSRIEDAWEVLEKVRGWSRADLEFFKGALGIAITNRRDEEDVSGLYRHVIHPSDWLLYLKPIDICRAALSSVKEGE